MKKRLCVLFAMALTGAMLVGCNSSESTIKPVNKIQSTGVSADKTTGAPAVVETVQTTSEPKEESVVVEDTARTATEVVAEAPVDKTEEFRKMFAEYMEEDNLEMVIRCYKQAEADGNIAIPDDIKAEYDTYTISKRNGFIEEAKAAYRAEGYQRALEVIREGKKLFDNDEELNRYQNIYCMAEPMDISNLNYIEEHNFTENANSKSDKFGNTYGSCATIGSMNVRDRECPNRAYVQLVLDKKYTKFKADIFNCTDRTNSKIKADFIADGVVIYESEGLTTADRARELVLDVENVEVLEIMVYSVDGCSGGALVLGNGVVYKELSENDLR